jgi:hypothetical protein
MKIDWKTELAVAWRVLQAIQGTDRQGLWSYHLPRVAATEAELLATETRLGFELDSMYRAFLGYANGWPDFYHCVDLLGTNELRGGELMANAKEMLSAIDEVVWHQNRIRLVDLLPIAVSKTDMDVFAIVTPSRDFAGEVIWFAGAVIERFENFDEFFLAMVDYNRVQLARLCRSPATIDKPTEGEVDPEE